MASGKKEEEKGGRIIEKDQELWPRLARFRCAVSGTWSRLWLIKKSRLACAYLSHAATVVFKLSTIGYCVQRRHSDASKAGMVLATTGMAWFKLRAYFREFQATLF